MSQFIDTANLDFIAYRNSLKAFLKNQTAFKDYDFEGSNFAILLDLLAYNTTMGAYYENMIGSEMFLDSAMLKDSIVSRSKELNYIPRSRSSARTNVTISVNTGGDSPSTITIPKYYNIKAAGVDANNNSLNYNFVTNTAILVQADSFGNYSASNVEIYEGNVVKEIFFANNTARYVLQSNTIDIDSIAVNIVNSNTDNTSTVWKQTIDIYGINDSSNVFFVQGSSDDKYELVFGNGVIGRALSNGNIVNVAYISTSGDDGNGLTAFSPTVAVEGYAITSIIPDEGAAGGSERESVDSIKFHAPKHFTTQERAVTDTDFENLVREKFPIVQSVRAYGGELLNPPQYGRVALFIKPFGIDGIISNNMKTNIVNYLAGKSITTKSFIVDPEYFYIRVISNVTYDPASLDIPLDQLKTNVVSAIGQFGTDNFTDFDSDLRYSKFVNTIDSVHDAIVSNDTSVFVIKRWSPSTGSIQNLKFSYGTELKKYDITSELDLGIDPTISSSIFSYIVNGISYSAKIEDNGIGVLKVIANNTAKNVLNTNIGTIDYDTGNIELNLNVSSYSGYISLYATTRAKDIEVSENRFIILDTIDTSVTLISE